MRILMIIGVIVSFLAVGLALSCSDDDDDDDHGGSNNDDDNDVNDDDDNNNNDDESDDDDNNDNDDFVDDDLGPCGELYPNPPTMWDLHAIINGERCEFPVSIYLNDTFIIAFEYEDLDCNLFWPGDISISSREVNGGPPFSYVESWEWPENAPCSSDEGGAPYMIDMDANDFVPSTEIDGYTIAISDSCIWGAVIPKFEVKVLDGKPSAK